MNSLTEVMEEYTPKNVSTEAYDRKPYTGLHRFNRPDILSERIQYLQYEKPHSISDHQSSVTLSRILYRVIKRFYFYRLSEVYGG